MAHYFLPRPVCWPSMNRDGSQVDVLQTDLALYSHVMYFLCLLKVHNALGNRCSCIILEIYFNERLVQTFT